MLKHLKFVCLSLKVMASLKYIFLVFLVSTLNSWCQGCNKCNHNILSSDGGFGDFYERYLGDWAFSGYWDNNPFFTCVDCKGLRGFLASCTYKENNISLNSSIFYSCSLGILLIQVEDIGP